MIFDWCWCILQSSTRFTSSGLFELLGYNISDLVKENMFAFADVDNSGAINKTELGKAW